MISPFNNLRMMYPMSVYQLSIRQALDGIEFNNNNNNINGGHCDIMYHGEFIIILFVMYHIR